jgi:hypothetical protein
MLIATTIARIDVSSAATGCINRALDFVRQTAVQFATQSRLWGTAVNETRDIDEIETADEGGFDPRAAADLHR